MIYRETAQQVWFAICNHDGFAGDRGEWGYGCGITVKKLDRFMEFVENAISEQPSIEDATVPKASNDAPSDTLEKVALDMFNAIAPMHEPCCEDTCCSLVDAGWGEGCCLYEFRDRLKALGVVVDG